MCPAGAAGPLHQYYEAAREQETNQRISQDLPNCNWLEQKIKLSEIRKPRKHQRYKVIIVAPEDICHGSAAPPLEEIPENRFVGRSHYQRVILPGN